MKYIAGLSLLAIVAGTVTVPKFIDLSPDLPPIVLADFEDGSYYGQHGGIQVGGAYGGERCFVGNPLPGQPATFMPNTGPFERSYIAFWAKADKYCNATVSIQGHDGSVSGNVPLAEPLNSEWKEYKIAVTNFGPIESILHFRIMTDRLATVHVDDLVAFSPEPVVEPEPEPDPDPDPEPEPDPEPVTTLRYRVGITRILADDGTVMFDLTVEAVE